MAEQVFLAQHPLLNSLVLSTVFEYVDDVHVLNKARLVCTTWRNESFKKWRSLATVTLVPAANLLQEEPLAVADSSLRPTNLWSIGEYLEEFLDAEDAYQLRSKPYRHFNLRGFCLRTAANLRVTEPHREEDAVEPNFWNIIGPLVQSISFERCNFQGRRPQILERILAEKLPNLSSLKFSGSTTFPPRSVTRIDPRLLNYYVGNDVVALKNNLRETGKLKSLHITGNSPFCLRMLLLNSPNIEKLVLNDNLSLTRGEYSFLALAILMGATRPKLNQSTFPLKHLDLMDVNIFDDAFMDTTRHWKRMNLPLEYLSLTLFGSGMNMSGLLRRPILHHLGDVENVLVPLARHHAETLQVLKIFRPPVNWDPPESPFRFPMIAMRELHLSGSITGNFDFLIYMPNLKVLHVDPKCHDNVDRLLKLFCANGLGPTLRRRYRPMVYDNRSTFKSGGNHAVRLEELEQFHWNQVLMPASVRTLAVQWMPNLKRLETVLGRHGFRSVCRWMSGLEELLLLQASEIDDETLTGIGGEDEARRFPHNITQLQCLKRFELRTACNIRKPRLGANSVYQGFLQIHALKTVNICASRDTMTEEAELALREHVANVDILYRHARNPTDMIGECCKIESLIGFLNYGIPSTGDWM